MASFLVGGVFNAVNQSVYAALCLTDPKVIHNFSGFRVGASRELALDFPTNIISKVVLPMRMCCALEHDQEVLKVSLKPRSTLL